MLDDYAIIGLLLLISLVVPGSMLFVSFLGSRVRLRPRPVLSGLFKTRPYECGIETEGSAWVRFNFRYYLFALLFVIFDIETVFFLPWAVAFRQLKIFGLLEMVFFILILLVGFAYAWKKEALEWD